jgi:DNA sulfur modification protein DndB
MANKTFIPALRARVGDWEYYICTMKYAEVAKQIMFAYELGNNTDLNSMIQRGISQRTTDIVSYLLNNEHRFLGAIIVACWGGNPQYVPLEMADPENVLQGIDEGFGVLTFDGTQSYFALDGQHRLRAVKETIKKNPNLGREDIAVIIVSHFDTEKGRERTRRLFTNINRNARVTTAAENIALDEDDGYSVLTRRLLTEHPLLSKEKVVKVFTMIGEEGEMRLAGKSISPADKYAFTTIVVLRSMIEDLWFESNEVNLKVRPADTVLEDAYVKVSNRLDTLLVAAGNLSARINSSLSMRDIRAPKGKEGDGHPMMRPVIQQAVTRVIRQIVTQGTMSYDEAVSRLSVLTWSIGAVPWRVVYNSEANKMITAKENIEGLVDLLYVHLAPPSLQAIRRARKNYRNLKSENYPVPEEALAVNLDQHRPGKEGAPSVTDIALLADKETLPADWSAEQLDADRGK